MQEEIVDKSVELGVRIAGLTAKQILKGLEVIISGLEKKQAETPNDAKEPKEAKEPKVKHGKQTLKELQKQNDGLSSIELKDPNLRQLYSAMKKDNIDFSAVKDGKGKYTLFFKGKDAEVMTHAFKQYTHKVVMQNATKPIKIELSQAKEAAKALDAKRDKVKNRSKGAIDI